ncbi:hypothetical protein KKE19_04120 [Patescibacteria group bacterium]|nr:hypothetical protein [Patescibacteria group bacterium]MBU4578664.1 hypothetical protein [Patescibacteria group bacterium]MCG2701798.1 hypothetical protein [Candidatus Parcubacteria bacterium]
MLIKQIDILVHPDFSQMPVPNWPLHESQLVLRKKWEERFELLEKQEDAILLYFSYLTINEVDRGLEDLSTITNKIKRDEIERIKKVKAMLGNRIIVFGWLAMPNFESFDKIFTSCGFTYVPKETKIHAYGEILGMCVWANANNVAQSLGIPNSNIEYNLEKSLTNNGSQEILNWQVFKMDKSFLFA